MKTSELARRAARVATMPESVLLGRAKDKPVARLRQAVMFVAHRKMRVSYAEIGRQLGKDHTTAMHADKAFEEFLRIHEPLALRYYKIAVRCWVKEKQAEAHRRAVMRKLIEGAEHACDPLREPDHDLVH